MFAQFTEQADRVVVRAQDEARMTGHESVEAEHVLLGLLWDQDGIPGRVFADLGITIEPVRDLVRERLGPGSGTCREGLLPMSLGAKKLLEFAGRAARTIPTARDDRGEALLAPEYPLLAFTRDSEGGAYQVLCALGADPNVIRFEVKKRVPRPGGRGAGAGAELRLIGFQPLSAEDAGPIFDSFVVDPVAQRLLVASARIAFDERRARFGLHDLLRAPARDNEASQLLAGLGVDLDVLRERLNGESPPAD